MTQWLKVLTATHWRTEFAYKNPKNWLGMVIHLSLTPILWSRKSGGLARAWGLPDYLKILETPGIS